jgi:hypothetical protein
LPDADDQGAVEEGRDAGLKVVVSILQSLNARKAVTAEPNR